MTAINKKMINMNLHEYVRLRIQVNEKLGIDAS